MMYLPKHSIVSHGVLFTEGADTDTDPVDPEGFVALQDFYDPVGCADQPARGSAWPGHPHGVGVGTSSGQGGTPDGRGSVS